MSKKITAVMFIGVLLAAFPAFAQAPTPQTPEECLTRVKSLEPMLPKMMESSKAAIQALIPDPADYEKKLPPFEKVIADKDATNLKNYGGLAEAYLFAGDKTHGDKLFSLFSANSRKILGADEIYSALVDGDVGFLYFYEKNYKQAEPLVLASIKDLETHLTAANSNNLVTEYMCITLMRDKAGNKEEAGAYAKKLIDLIVKQRQKPF